MGVSEVRRMDWDGRLLFRRADWPNVESFSMLASNASKTCLQPGYELKLVM